MELWLADRGFGATSGAAEITTVGMAGITVTGGILKRDPLDFLRCAEVVEVPAMGLIVLAPMLGSFNASWSLAASSCERCTCWMLRLMLFFQPRMSRAEEPVCIDKKI